MEKSVDIVGIAIVLSYYDRQHRSHMDRVLPHDPMERAFSMAQMRALDAQGYQCRFVRIRRKAIVVRVTK